MQGEFGAPYVVSATGVVTATNRQLLGFFCNSTSTGTIILYDSSTAGTSNPISGTITPTAGTFYRFPASLANGLYVVVANTLNVTVFLQ